MSNTQSLIRKTPHVMGGEACIRNTRIAVWMLVLSRKMGMSDEQLLIDYPDLMVQDLDAAWDYYRLHPGEIERAIWLNDTAANYDTGAPIPPWVLVSGMLLDISPDEMRESFETPISDEQLTAAWSSYRADPAGVLREVSRHRLAG